MKTQRVNNPISECRPRARALKNFKHEHTRIRFQFVISYSRSELARRSHDRNRRRKICRIVVARHTFLGKPVSGVIGSPSLPVDIIDSGCLLVGRENSFPLWWCFSRLTTVSRVGGGLRNENKNKKKIFSDHNRIVTITSLRTYSLVLHLLHIAYLTFIV